ncbi:MAG: ABC transporter substrate-binding protein [Magnetovibrio sp.]|nr:ABC transporter substrate-binding protein [Magnetovibrio sp.]
MYKASDKYVHCCIVPTLKAFVCALVVMLFSSGYLSAADNIVLQLRWDHQFQFAGFYAAKWNGYYRERGLHVEIKSAFSSGKRVNSLQEVIDGRARFGIGGADILLARDQGANLAIVASYFQRSPVEVFVAKDNGIQSPADLVGKKMVTGIDPLIDAEVDAMFRLEGIKVALINKVPLPDGVPSYKSLGPLVRKEVDAVPVYALSSLWAADKSGVQVHRIRPAAYGVNFYGDSLVVDAQWGRENLAQVKAFTDATRLGWEYALTHQKEMISKISLLLKRHLPLDNPIAYNTFLAEQIESLMIFPTIEPGSVNPKRWEQIGQTLFHSGLISSAPSGDDFVLLPDKALASRNDQIFRNSAISAFALFLTLSMFVIWQRSMRMRDIRFRELFENMHNGVAVYRSLNNGENFEFTDFNKGGERIEGILRQHLIGKRITDILPSAQKLGLLDVFKRVWSTGEPEHFPLSFYEDGKLTGWRNSYVYKLPDGEIVAIYEDTTAQKQAEEALASANKELEGRISDKTADLREEIIRHKITLRQLRLFSQAVEQSPYMIFITTIEGVIQYSNPKFSKMTGYSFSEAFGQTPSLIKSGDTPRAVYTDLWTTILAGKNWRGELKDRAKNGSVFWAAASISPVRDSNNRITHFVAMHEDITHRRLADKKIRLAIDQAEAASRAKTELLANMNHELRTPLNAIIGFSDLMRNEIFGPIHNEKYLEYANDILQSGEHLLDLVNRILDVSAIESGKLELHEESLNIPDFIEDCLLLVRPHADQAEVILLTDISDDLPKIYADHLRIRQVLSNLLSNAIKYSMKGGSVTITARIFDTGCLTISVSDTGIGMTQSELVKAMSHFGQVDAGLDRKHEGSGLGLPLAQNLIDLHGGEFHIESEEGNGTTVTISFPRERVI